MSVLQLRKGRLVKLGGLALVIIIVLLFIMPRGRSGPEPMVAPLQAQVIGATVVYVCVHVCAVCSV